MVPDKFNMVDMGGIDLIMMQGEEVPGLYDRLVESIAQCRYQCLYNWLFDGVIIPPTYVELEVNENDEVAINEGVIVTEDDVIHIYSIEHPIEPVTIPLLAEENGTYNAPEGVDGFQPVTVDVPSYTPVINPISITENGTYTVPSDVDGYSPVTVNVSVANYMYVTPARPKISTGLSTASISKVIIHLKPLSNAEGAIFGSSWAVNGFFLMIYGGKFRFHSGGTVIDMSTVSVGDDYIIECGQDYCKINDVNYSLIPSGSNSGNLNLFTPESPQGNAEAMVVMECSIYVSDNLVKHFIPTNANGMYETLSDEVIYNTGTGVLVKI